jgi:hypothetical protein
VLAVRETAAVAAEKQGAVTLETLDQRLERAPERLADRGLFRVADKVFGDGAMRLFNPSGATGRVCISGIPFLSV